MQSPGMAGDCWQRRNVAPGRPAAHVLFRAGRALLWKRLLWSMRFSCGPFPGPVRTAPLRGLAEHGGLTFSRSCADRSGQGPCRMVWSGLFPVPCGSFGSGALSEWCGLAFSRFPDSVRGSWGRPGSAKGAARAIKKARRGVRRALRGVEELSPRGVFQACGPRWPGGWCPGCGVAAWGA